MKVNYRLVIGVIVCFYTISLSAQKTWTLRDCIDYARQENIQVKKSQLTAESYEIDIKQSKAELFPSLSGNISQTYNHAKNEQNNYKYEGTFAGQYGLNASWTIFNGNQNLNSIKQSKLQKEAEELNTEQQQNDIEISITQTYLQLLYARESIKNNENILASSEAQLKQTKDFLDAGSITRSEYAQVEAQYSSDKYNLVAAQNSFDSYKLQLKQLLELDITDEFDVNFPTIGDEEVVSLIPSKYEVYRTALEIMPELKNSKLNIELAELEKSSAKGGYLPTVSLNGSIGTGNTWDSSPSFSTQINRRFNQYIGVSVSIPIFDNRRNKSNVQKAEIQKQTAELNYTDTQKTLLRTIEGLYLDATSAQSKYQAAKDKLTSTELSYTLVKEQYALGMRNTVELTTEQNNYANALQELLQAKYSALLSVKLLKFYQGQEITL
ncbi:TolC family protein [Dysgonomonas sp. 216]|uniref:TolC family protein n=1 Tax=Dysgonomonas sp. 216 TaxID=2302934 RepID=UPI0013D40B64|nr:TolC family protein [Dysgonomonas sp. 216]NDW18462.1 TolC family protein [Dysgonomonas sp. 216]